MSKKKIYSNIDIDLTDAERYKTERDEYNTHLVDEQIKNTDDYKSHGFLNARNATVTKTQEEWDAKDVRERRAAGKPVLPVWVMETETGDIVYILSDADREAVQHGYICENCLGWQKDNLTLKCETLKGFSCNYTKRSP